MQLFSTKPNPTRMMDQLSRLRTKKESQLNELAKMQMAITNTEAEIYALECALAQHLGMAAPSSHTTQEPKLLHNTQPPATTTANQGFPVPAQVTQAPQTQIRKPMAQATTTEQTPQRGIQPCTSTPVPVSTLAPQRVTAQVQHTRPSGVQVPNVSDMITRRAPYHTEELQITGVVPVGEIVMYEHYLSGDGTNYGVPPLEGYPVKVKTSKAGKAYRLMKGPTLKITCTLAAPLPESLPEKKRVIKEWLAANNYMACSDPNKVQFYTEYDAWGEEYTPYVTVDSKGLNLYIYIGASSLENPTPCPWLIA